MQKTKQIHPLFAEELDRLDVPHDFNGRSQENMRRQMKLEKEGHAPEFAAAMVE